MNIGEYLREQRIGKGISHEKLAKAAGVSKRSLIYWEQGEKDISLDNADKVLKALNASLTIGAR
ncbi:helix-turn-helix transcriptional regulator [Hungatella sp. L12]|uniref:Helix-turn-helix transcriptional regulator n=1 Tax=Hungatella hominis TaxID=2763050 RepID=A0ABR7HGN6_9FIRM|nr:helix-turn-helix transcriptional regulator [Hungatella hominis]MBC5712353.1 helix-turn-helix transcriptional regulator [Hungatella hominis]